MDDIIYEEFKGTGNMEIHLDRELSDRRIFPAIDLRKSSTRREEMLLSQKELEGMWLIRRKLSRADNFDACLQLMDMITCTATNDEFIDTLKLVK
jgi:transcription termination factor Rho